MWSDEPTLVLITRYDTRECMHNLCELLSSQQTSVTLSCEKPNDFWQNSKKGSVLTLFRGGKLIPYSANNLIWGSSRSHQTRLQQAMKTLKSSLLTLLCLARMMSTFGPNNFSVRGRAGVVIDACFETCEHLVYMSSTKEPRGFYLSRVAKNPEIFHLKQRILLNSSSHFTGVSSSKHISDTWKQSLLSGHGSPKDG